MQPTDFSHVVPGRSLSDQINDRDARYAGESAAPNSTQRTFFSRHDRLHDPLYVVTPVFNAVRYRSRWKHLQDFSQRCAEAGMVLITVEAAFGDRDFAATVPGNPYHVQLRTRSELWLKESLINRGVARLSEIHPDWKKVAWVDADVNFERDDVADETRHQLEHYDVVQMWSYAQDMNSENEPLSPYVAKSYAHCYMEGVPRPSDPSAGYPYALPGRKGWYWHPGYAWACTREWWDGVGGLVDVAIIGNGDFYMAEGMCGRINAEPHKCPSENYRRVLEQWQRRCIQTMGKGDRGGLGCVRGLVTHKWHGAKADRGYKHRWKLLVEHKFDPTIHLKRDRQLLWTLDQEAPTALRDGLRKYARSRNEDAL